MSVLRSVEEWLTQIEPFIGIVVSERSQGTSGNEHREDAQQEARIACWRALDKNPDNPRSYLIATVRNRATKALSRHDWTGKPSRQGAQTPEPLDLAGDQKRSLDRMLDDGFAPEAADLLAQVEEAYHHGRVHEALDRLPHRAKAYCVLRFWYGLSEPEIAARLGTSVKTVNNDWNRTVRPRLAEELSTLRDRHLMTA